MAEASTGAAAAPKSKSKTVKVDIRRTPLHSRGTSYGPGKDLEIPAAVAERLGLTGKKAEARKAKTTRKSARRTKRSS